MKKFLNVKILLLAFFVLGFIQIDANASDFGKSKNLPGGISKRPHGNAQWVKPKHPGHHTVGAPIDGGLVVLLLGGGIAFFVVKKKKAVTI
jgi:hypothetical protein